MKSWLNILLISVVLLSVQLPPASANQTNKGQTAQNSEQSTGQNVKIGTSEVLLDVVARDKKGKPVKDLTASDFQILEDGVKQDIRSFRIHQTGSGESAASAGKDAPASTRTGAEPNPFAGVSVVALVFDRLRPEARELAHKAALGYVSSSRNQQDLAGVFAIDLSLHVFQPFTNNSDLLKQAIDRASTYSASDYPSNSDQIAEISSKMKELQVVAVASTPTVPTGGGPGSTPPSGGGAGQAAIALATAKMTLSALEGFEELERDEQGYATTNGLLAIIDSLKGIEGRKAIVFLSEGVAIRPEVAYRFGAVINEANRANVSIYAIDAAGLRTDSPLASTREQTNAIADTRMLSQESGAEDTSGRPMTKDLERNEDVLHFNPHSGLTLLSDQTGGFLIKDTNDLKTGFSRIDEDMRFHYELSYVPKNSSYDGKFRQISVKLDRPGVDVLTRKGYYAVPSTGSPVLNYEIPALAALANSQAKDDPAMQAGAFSFPRSNNPGLVPVLVQVPADEFSYEIDKTKNTYNADFTIVVLLKDQSGQPAGKLSQHYHMSGPADKVDVAKRGEVLFYREAELPPGEYSVQTIAFDTPSRKESEKSTSVEVPQANGSDLRLSSVAVLQRVERLSEADKKLDNPFHYGEVLLYPNLGQPLSKASSKQLAFFCAIFPAKGAAAAPKLDLQVLSGGKSIFDTSPALGPVDSSGRIQYAGALPLDAFQPGTYSLQMTVSDGRTSTSRTAEFTVKP